MAFDETVAARVRKALGRRAGITEKRMFGGLAFLLHGNMCCGVVGKDLMLRLGEGAARALEEPHVRPMDFTGKPLKTMVYVKPGAALERWVGRAVTFARTLPPKGLKARATRPRRAQRRIRR